ncbi:hypothetical protein Glove_22g237 [Diversispora epigaea]|uniref:Uncharacterized protein n=1 Tax=Diversispora epigaea TaxID=1348612 RepID=A0A397JLQ5_9GLOM|nr:hypothetical protein Glove_22g237 [Diversispora epigaea]
MSDKAHKSKDFCKNSVEHFGAYRRFTSLPYTSANTASSYNLNHRSCVDNLLNSLVPLSNYVNKFIQDYYRNINYHWDKLDAPNCLCCLIPLGDFQGGELYFPQLHTFIPLQPGKVVAFSSHYLLHGNFLLISDGIRHSIVYFVHNIFFHEDDNFNFMKIDDAELESKLHNNQGLNSKTPTFTKPRKFQTMEYTNDNNDINQRQRNLNN